MAGIEQARAQALAVLRVRGLALGVACLPAAAAVVVLVGLLTDRLGGWVGWAVAAWAVSAVGVLALLVAGAVGLVLWRARPASSPVVPLDAAAAPDLYRLIGELAERLEVPAPTAIALTPDCDSWLEERQPAPGARRAARPGRRGGGPGQLLVIGSPFLWWMRVAELRALLAPVVSGTAAAADPDIAAARRFVRGLDAAVAVAAEAPGPVRSVLGRIARLLLRACRGRAAEMERAVAAWASEHAQSVDFGLRVAAQQQVGLAYAGWDRLLTRVALPAWRMGRWPSRLDAGVVSALTELSRRDRLAEGFETRLGERPACDLLERPGDVDRAASLLAARLFHGGPEQEEVGWSPVEWSAYPEEIVDRIWRTEAAELVIALGPGAPPGREATLDTVLGRLVDDPGLAERVADALTAADTRARAHRAARWPGPVVELQPARTGRELLAEHVAALVCGAVVDTAGGRPGLDWLDGPALFVHGTRCKDLGGPVQQLLEGDEAPLRGWLGAHGVRTDKPVRLG
ncbi:hypothetical protein BIV57_04690 [Mangrovactinospora gilvigrisea]|uniref:Uncharacterized protein n=1 Tax=Mangrovactinospora gilvigrisea TaxID=1428644 RepID=A0A1J7CAY0_9ACTN|nr:hypothetical protein [Mangrovactinospora gilvigrisea]OIV38684.1 hypothetical protein BIV57_04690 [Mangrovactinospora gilvigrisea]